MLCRNKIKVYLCTRNQKRFLFGTLTEWLGSGLQNRVQQFESAGYLMQEGMPVRTFLLFLLCRDAEHVSRQI